MVFYRKYRPQRIDELDLISVREKLSSILKSTDIPHAFLFTGPKGLGKTSAARIVAKAINCELRASSNQSFDKTQDKLASSSKKQKKTIEQLSNETIEPCNECSACVSITNGSNVDVLEIDAASNRGIDEIRTLRERIKYLPATLPKKVYIIDEVHMLTTEAFNALLKTLEEPPDHALFILCTTELWKLPSTIVSRAFHIEFQKPTIEQIANSLLRIVKGESLVVENGVLEKIAELSDGAFRDAAKILEELALSGDKKITKELLEKAYKTTSIDGEVKNLLTALSKKNTQEALRAISTLSNSGCDFKVVIEKSVEYLRNFLLKKTGFEVNVADIEFTIDSLQSLLDEFNQAYKNIKFSVLPQLPLELVVVKYCVIDTVTREKVKGEVNVSSNKLRLVSPAGRDSSSFDKLRIQNDKGVQSSKPDGLASSFFFQLLDRVKKENVTLAGVLRSCRVESITDSTITLLAPYKFHGEKLSDAKTHTFLEKIASEILGKNVKIVVTIKENN